MPWQKNSKQSKDKQKFTKKQNIGNQSQNKQSKCEKNTDDHWQLLMAIAHHCMHTCI